MSEKFNLENTNEEIKKLPETKKATTQVAFDDKSKLSDDETKHVADLMKLAELSELVPTDLIVKPLIWKTLVRAIYRSENIMITGPSGSGKTLAVYSVANTLDRKLFTFNLGATQDPRTTLIGQTHFDTKKGTYFNTSLFVRAIQQPNAIILLDEISRANHEAWNILISVLDPMQRYLRIDEEVNTPTVEVADGVCFISTANIGVEYTATRTIDRAITDRFTIVEMKFLSYDDEKTLIERKYKYIAPSTLDIFLTVIHKLRDKAAEDSSQISNTIGTRAVKNGCAMLNDGFSLNEVVEMVVYPVFDKSGGINSERTEAKQVIQAYVID